MWDTALARCLTSLSQQSRAFWHVAALKIVARPTVSRGFRFARCEDSPVVLLQGTHGTPLWPPAAARPCGSARPSIDSSRDARATESVSSSVAADQSCLVLRRCVPERCAEHRAIRTRGTSSSETGRADEAHAPARRVPSQRRTAGIACHREGSTEKQPLLRRRAE